MTFDGHNITRHITQTQFVTACRVPQIEKKKEKVYIFPLNITYEIIITYVQK